MNGIGRRELGIWASGLAVGVVVTLLLASDREPEPSDAQAPAAEVVDADIESAVTLVGRPMPAASPPAVSTFQDADVGATGEPIYVSADDDLLATSTAIRVVFPGATRQQLERLELYVLAAGAPGADDQEDLPHADNETGFLIPLVRGGRYDVGCKFAASFHLKRDVEAKDGETTVVELALPDEAYLDVRFAGTLGPDEGASLHLGANQEAGVTYPGRGQTLRWFWAMTWRGEWAADLHLSVPPDAEITAAAGAVEWNQDKQVPAERIRAACDPGVVRAGDTLRVGVQPAARLSLRFECSPPARDHAVAKLTIDIAQGEERQTIDTTAAVDSGAENSTHTAWFHVLVAPGRGGTVRWSGNGLRPGSLTFDAIAAGLTGAVTVPLTPETDWDAVKIVDDDASGGATQAIRLVGLSERDIEWFGLIVMGRFGPHHPTDPGPQATSDYDDEDGVLPGPWGEALELGAVCGPFKVARKRDNAPGRETILRFEKGGLVVIVSDRPVPDELGTLRVARLDGFPVAATDAGESATYGPSWAASPVNVTSGQILGPFPPGRLTLRVWIGRTRLDDVEVNVRPGRVTPLIIHR